MALKIIAHRKQKESFVVKEMNEKVKMKMKMKMKMKVKMKVKMKCVIP